MEWINFKYHIELESGEKKNFKFLIHSESLLLKSDSKELEPWTALGFEKCEHCPLSEDAVDHCPVAQNLAPLIEPFKNHQSHSRAKVWVKGPERTYFKEVALQEALFSMFGLAMATSSCPRLTVLRPMARFHLPFSSLDESLVRGISMYLFRQYFLNKNAQPADFELKELGQAYSDIEKVNQGLARRIQSIEKSGDASQNSVTTLDCISKMLSLALKKDFNRFDYLFTEKDELA